MTQDLAAWLLEQIAEDERRATAIDPDGVSGSESWHTQRCGYRQGEWQEPCDCGVPARVAAECDAKRQIINHYVACLEKYGEDNEVYALYVLGLRRAVDRLVPPYIDRPGYREEWVRQADTPR